MWDRRSLKWPITLGVTLLVLLALLTVGWVLLTITGLAQNSRAAPLYWTFLAVGSVLLGLVIAGVAMYLNLTIKTINLNRRQANFMDSITHELKSPITSLKLYLQTLDRHAVSAEEQAKFHRFMLEDVERLDGLINHVLDAARLDRQPAEADAVEEIEVEPVLRRCVEEVSSRYRVAPDLVRMEIEPSLVRARRVDLDMIFRNLVDNAIKYAGEPAVVAVISHPRPDGTVVTQVSDNGPGIPLRYRHKIFGRFVRLGSELERAKPGTGLGLYIVHTLVQRLRGKVRVRDRDGGPGTVFEVSLPGRTLETKPPRAA
jgi:two-component system, OmpR family, phosphate regulon sensor histidine kinase PhoR